LKKGEKSNEKDRFSDSEAEGIETRGSSVLLFDKQRRFGPGASFAEVLSAHGYIGAE